MICHTAPVPACRFEPPPSVYGFNAQQNKVHDWATCFVLWLVLGCGIVQTVAGGFQEPFQNYSIIEQRFPKDSENWRLKELYKDSTEKVGLQLPVTPCWAFFSGSCLHLQSLRWLLQGAGISKSGKVTAVQRLQPSDTQKKGAYWQLASNICFPKLGYMQLGFVCQDT